LIFGSNLLYQPAHYVSRHEQRVASGVYAIIRESTPIDEELEMKIIREVDDDAQRVADFRCRNRRVLAVALWARVTPAFV
jgi:hypothetical protein